MRVPDPASETPIVPFVRFRFGEVIVPLPVMVELPSMRIPPFEIVMEALLVSKEPFTTERFPPAIVLLLASVRVPEEIVRPPELIVKLVLVNIVLLLLMVTLEFALIDPPENVMMRLVLFAILMNPAWIPELVTAILVDVGRFVKFAVFV